MGRWVCGWVGGYFFCTLASAPACRGGLVCFGGAPSTPAPFPDYSLSPSIPRLRPTGVRSLGLSHGSQHASLLAKPRTVLVALAQALGLPWTSNKASIAVRLLDFLDDPGRSVRPRGGGAPAAAAGGGIPTAGCLSSSADMALSAAPVVGPAGGGSSVAGLSAGAIDFLSSSFSVGESPFAVPVAPPLGRPVLLAASQLSRAFPQCSLMFPTPSSLTWASLSAAGGAFAVAAPGDDGPEDADGPLRVHLRCLRVDRAKTPTAWTQEWPFPVYANVNGQVLPLAQGRRTAMGVVIGPDSGTDMTRCLLPAHPTSTLGLPPPPGLLNVVTLHRSPPGSPGGDVAASSSSAFYALFAQVVREVSDAAFERLVASTGAAHVEQLRRRLGVAARRADGSASTPFDVAVADAAAFLSGGGLTVEAATVSLRCPLSLARLTTPVKGVDCKHLQCFDIGMFLSYARRSRKFACPVCNRPTASPERLWVSPLLTEALRLFPDADEVEVRADGSLRLPSPKGGAADGEGTSPAGRRGNAVERPAKRPRIIVDVNDVCDADEEEGVGGTGGAPPAPAATAAASAAPAAAAAAAPPAAAPPSGGMASAPIRRHPSTAPPPLSAVGPPPARSLPTPPPPPPSEVVVVDLTGDSD